MVFIMGLNNSVIFLQQMLKVNMRYIYNIKDEQGSQETFKAMSYTKCLKQLSIKYKNKLVQIKYTNKKDHELIKLVKIKEVD